MSQDPYPGERQQPYQQPYQQSKAGDYPSGGYQAGDYPASAYQSGGYQTGPYQPYQPSYASLEGEKAAQLSLILGIVGLFVAGIVLGPLAIWQARKAERLGVPATAGKVLGWITTILYALAILAGIIFFVILAIGLSATSTYSG